MKNVSAYFPDPIKEYDLDPDDPQAQDALEKLRVHIDAIKPVWRTNLQTDWFDLLDSKFKTLMHPYDFDKAPDGSGWVIQMICHHYNPYPTTRDQFALDPKDPKRTDFGPYQFITEKVLNKLNSPYLRLFGVHHVALAWMTEDREWTSDKGAQHNNLASNSVPVLDRAAAPKEAAGGGGGAGPVGGMAQGMERMMAMNQSGQNAMRAGQNAGAAGTMGMMRMGGMGAGGGMMGPGMGMGKASEEELKKLKKLTRTDFLLQFVWQPPKPEELPKTPEERDAKVKEISDKMTEAQKNNPAVTIPKGEEIEAASREKSKQVDSAISNALGGGAPGAPGAPAGAAPPAAPATKGAPGP
jgi:type IV pilus assembly protein PilM